MKFSIVTVSYNSASTIMQGLILLELLTTGAERNYRPVDDYSMSNVSDKVTRIIISYTDYIKREVWSVS